MCYLCNAHHVFVHCSIASFGVFFLNTKSPRGCYSPRLRRVPDLAVASSGLLCYSCSFQAPTNMGIRQTFENSPRAVTGHSLNSFSVDFFFSTVVGAEVEPAQREGSGRGFLVTLPGLVSCPCCL